MKSRYIFHLAFPVSNLATSRHFYVQVLGAAIGRESPDWLDILLWGHQITLHLQPGQMMTREQRGTRHFGVVLPWTEWQDLADRLQAEGTDFFRNPEVLLVNTPEEQAKLYLEDPDNNIIEIKAYRNFSDTLNHPDSAYNYEQ